MNNVRGKKILIFQQRRWGENIGHFLAKKLQDEGAILAALTIRKKTYEFVMKQKEVQYEEVIDSDFIKVNPKKFLAGDIITLEEVCRELGIYTIWPLVQSARNHVRSYQDKFYYGFKQNFSDDEIIDYVKAIYKNIKKVFHTFKPDLIITPNFVALQQRDAV